MLYKTEGIITKITSLKEADKIVSIYSKNKGMIRAVAKGSKKTKSRLAGRIDLFCRNNFLIVQGKNLDLISGADIIDNYYDIRNDYDKIMTASYILNILNKTALPGINTSELYELTQKTLELLTSHDDYDKIKQLFQKKFLEIEGIAGNIENISDKEFDRVIDHYLI